VSNTQSRHINAVFLAKVLRTSLIAQLLVGCFMSFPGASMDVLLKQFKWSEGDFGFAVLLQGLFGLLGNLYANWRVKTLQNIESELRVALALVAIGAFLAYFWEIPASLLFATAHNQARVIGYAFIGFGVGLLAIINNTRALRSENPSTALMLVAFTFTFGALFFPFITSAHLASLSQFTTHNWKLVLVPILALTIINLFVPTSTNNSGVSKPLSTHTHTSSNSNTGAIIASKISPWNLGVQLFFYMGIEINLTLGSALLLMRSKGVADSLARFAPSALWLGILTSRLLTTLFPLPIERFRRWTWQLAIVLAALLAANVFGPSASSIIWMSLIVITGLVLGPFYGLIVGQSAHLWHGISIAQNAAVIATFGSAGAVVLPFLFGQITENYGINTGFMSILYQVIILASFSIYTSYRSRKIEC
jgi:hypothetical protein